MFDVWCGVSIPCQWLFIAMLHSEVPTTHETAPSRKTVIASVAEEDRDDGVRPITCFFVLGQKTSSRRRHMLLT